jgi:hypothetical protein
MAALFCCQSKEELSSLVCSAILFIFKFPPILIQVMSAKIHTHP